MACPPAYLCIVRHLQNPIPPHRSLRDLEQASTSLKCGKSSTGTPSTDPRSPLQEEIRRLPR
ncbi:hypothetical protein C7212DRAFT_338676 [Tuber magnatum]|uniref:Uncharacterized protein n=1 Tax=Tuber magnatum TaxID=42249 RepID=A0A317SB24_9PEZI|nr:hypothetical protein C7212DRAFT_338676 [Tuber magnatum]